MIVPVRLLPPTPPLPLGSKEKPVRTSRHGLTRLLNGAAPAPLASPGGMPAAHLAAASARAVSGFCGHTCRPAVPGFTLSPKTLKP